MSAVSIVRSVAQSIETCDSFRVVTKENKVQLFFYHAQPVDRVKWIFRSEFYNKYLKNIIEATNSKRITS